MRIYKLTPIKKESVHWRASVWKDHVDVRAENEKQARDITADFANLYFNQTTKNTGPNGKTLHNPWTTYPDLVGCQRSENSNYKEDGPAEVLYPTPNLV